MVAVVSADRGSTVSLFAAAADRPDVGSAANAQLREMCADRVSNLVAGKMCVVLFSHSRVGMTQLFGDDRHWNPPLRWQNHVCVVRGPFLFRTYENI
jgi:hypothetical protein